MGQSVFRDYDQEALDRAFDQRVWASNAVSVLDSYKAAGEAVIAEQACYANLQYGAGADERLDWFPTTQAKAPIHFHIHGGAWRFLRKEDVAFAAPMFTSAGQHYIAPDFGALPSVRLTDVVQQLIRAVAWVYTNAKQFGGDRNRIFISGHSSGGHLCAVLLATDWTLYGLPPDVLKGGLCISGIYDMEPVLISARRSYIDLSETEKQDMSPLLNTGFLNSPVSIVYAQNDSPEFIRQAHHFHEVIQSSGKSADLNCIPGMNHYEIIGALAQIALSCGALKL